MVLLFYSDNIVHLFNSIRADGEDNNAPVEPVIDKEKMDNEVVETLFSFVFMSKRLLKCR